MSTVFCLDCDRELTLAKDDAVDDIIICNGCESEFQIVSVDPPEIIWSYADYDDDDWDDENESANGQYSDWDDDEEDGEWSWMIAKQRRHHAQDHVHEEVRERRVRLS